MTESCRTFTAPAVVDASDGVRPSGLCRVRQERSVISSAVIGTSGTGQVAGGALDHVANAAKPLRHVRELLSRGGIAHVVVFQEHLQLHVRDAARTEEEEAEALEADHELTGELGPVPEDVETGEQIIDTLTLDAAEAHELLHRLRPLLLSELAPALRQRVHQERHRRDLHAVDEAALYEDLGRPLVNVLACHSSQARGDECRLTELGHVGVGHGPEHDLPDPTLEREPRLHLRSPGAEAADVAAAAASSIVHAREHGRRRDHADEDALPALAGLVAHVLHGLEARDPPPPLGRQCTAKSARMAVPCVVLFVGVLGCLVVDRR